MAHKGLLFDYSRYFESRPNPSNEMAIPLEPSNKRGRLSYLYKAVPLVDSE